LTRSSKNSSPSLKKRIQCLESRVGALEARLGIYDPPAETQRKPGPPPKISQEDLLENRDRLVDWLEINWPEMGPQLLSAKGPEAIVAALVPYAGPEASRSFILKRLFENAGALLSFLRSGRFRRKPPKRAVLDALNKPWDDERKRRGAAKLPTRQIANAMAGVPELEWRTSLDRCSKVPSRLSVGKRTEDHYRELYGVPLPKRGGPPGGTLGGCAETLPHPFETD